MARLDLSQVEIMEPDTPGFRKEIEDLPAVDNKDAIKMEVSSPKEGKTRRAASGDATPKKSGGDLTPTNKSNSVPPMIR